MMNRAALPILATAIAVRSAPAAAQEITFQQGKAWPLCSDTIRNECVVDGDTIRTNGKRVKIVGLDAPERRDEAKCVRERRLGELAAGHAVADGKGRPEWCR